MYICLWLIFSYFRSKNYDCQDLNTACKAFVKLDPNSCSPTNNETYNFMKFGCMKSCDRCGQKVGGFIKLSLGYLGATRYRWQIWLSKIWLFLNLVKHTLKNLKTLWISFHWKYFFRAVLMSLKNVETGRCPATVSAIRSSCSSTAESPVAPVDSDLVSQGWNSTHFLRFLYNFVQLHLTEADMS